MPTSRLRHEVQALLALPEDEQMRLLTDRFATGEHPPLAMVWHGDVDANTGPRNLPV